MKITKKLIKEIVDNKSKLLHSFYIFRDYVDIDIVKTNISYLLYLKETYNENSITIDQFRTLRIYYNNKKDIVEILFTDDGDYYIITEEELMRQLSIDDAVNLSSEIRVSYLESGEFFDSFDDFVEQKKEEFRKYGLTKYKAYLLAVDDYELEYVLHLDFYPCDLATVFDRKPINNGRMNCVFERLRRDYDRIKINMDYYNVNL